jgi:hypothetical protein
MTNEEEDGWVVMSVGDRLDGEIANKRSVEHRKVPVSRK